MSNTGDRIQQITGEVIEEYDSGYSLPRGVRIGNPDLEYDAEYKVVKVVDDGE